MRCQLNLYLMKLVESQLVLEDKLRFWINMLWLIFVLALLFFILLFERLDTTFTNYTAVWNKITQKSLCPNCLGEQNESLLTIPTQSRGIFPYKTHGNVIFCCLFLCLFWSISFSFATSSMNEITTSVCFLQVFVVHDWAILGNSRNPYMRWSSSYICSWLEPTPS